MGRGRAVYFGVVVLLGYVNMTDCSVGCMGQSGEGMSAHIPMIVGHRGSAGTVAENTLASFEAAIAAGAAMVELDVHCCQSGELIVMHDETVDRTTNGSGEIADKALDELKSLCIKGQHEILTLPELFDRIGRRIKINIELKGVGTGIPVAKLIDEYIANRGGQSDDFMISSLLKENIAAFRESSKHGVPVALLIGSDQWDVPEGDDAAEWLALQAQRVGVSVLVIQHDYINADVVNALHAQGLKVSTFTPNTDADLKRVIDAGVDGVITDYPARAVALVT